jgi:hypothetical protein
MPLELTGKSVKRQSAARSRFPHDIVRIGHKARSRFRCAREWRFIAAPASKKSKNAPIKE